MMMILGVAITTTLLAMAGLIGAGLVTSSAVANYFEREAGLITGKNKRRFQAELDKLSDLIRSREGKKELAQQGVDLEQAILGSLGSPEGLALPTLGEEALGANAPVDESVPPLGPTAGLEVDEGALLAESLGVSQDQVKQAARPPVPPALSLFGGGPG